MMKKKYDIFISHASEDKDAIVRPMAILLERLGVRAWYDEFSLKLGDSLTASIDKGLQESRYGLIILSKAFLRKKWTDYEYRSLMTREIDGERVILPLWYDVTKDDVKEFSLYLADIKALPISRDALNVVIPAILQVARPDIWHEIRMRGILRKHLSEGTQEMVDVSKLKASATKMSKLSKHQLVRSKAIFYGIGRHLSQTFDEYVDQLELDVVPEMELQTWEIMNACYLEMLERHKDDPDKDEFEYYKVLVMISLGVLVHETTLSRNDIEELLALWRENYYEF